MVRYSGADTRLVAGVSFPCMSFLEVDIFFAQMSISWHDEGLSIYHPKEVPTAKFHSHDLRKTLQGFGKKKKKRFDFPELVWEKIPKDHKK